MLRILLWFKSYQVVFMGALITEYFWPLFCQVGSDTNLSDSLRVKAISCIAFLIKLKSKVKLEISYNKNPFI